MIDVASLGLVAGAAAEIAQADGRAWHIQAGEDGSVWLSSPPLSPPPGDDLQRTACLKRALESLPFSASGHGARLVQLDSGQRVLQWAWPTGVEPSALWREVMTTEAAWSAAWQSGAPMLSHRPLGDADESDIFSQLLGVVQQDEELRPLVSADEQQRTLVIDANDDSWVVGVLCGPDAHHATLAMPLRVVPSDSTQAGALFEKALLANAGLMLGPHMQIGLDATDPDVETLLLVMRITTHALQADDLKAAVGRLLVVGAELTALWGEGGDALQLRSWPGRLGSEAFLMKIQG